MKSKEEKWSGLRKITLFIVTDMKDASQEALNEVGKLTNIEVRVISCPASMQESYECPFIKDEKDRAFYGLNGIKFFVKRAISMAAHQVTVPQLLRNFSE